MGHTRMSRDRTILTLGVALLAIFFALMLAEVEPFHTFFYLFAWWTFIPVIGAINRLKTGDSLVLGDGSRFFWMASCSVVVEWAAAAAAAAVSWTAGGVAARKVAAVRIR